MTINTNRTTSDRLAKVPTEYSLPSAMTGNQVPTTDDDSIRINHFKSTIIASVDGMIRFMPRQVWGAKPARDPPTPLHQPLEFVILTHTAGIGSFSTTLECVQGVKECQQLHMANFGWADIAYNFLVGNDGAVYEGRGWDYQGSTAKGWNSVSIGIAFIGKYLDNMPSPQAIDATKSFLQYLVDEGKLKKDFTIHCLRQVRDIFKEAPGDALYSEIQRWQARGKHTWAWRERDDEDTNAIPVAERLTEVHKKNILAQKTFLEENVTTPGEILDILHHKGAISERKCKNILSSTSSDADLTSKIVDMGVRGRKSFLAVLMDALLQTNQRMVAKTLYKSLPEKDRASVFKPQIQQKKVPGYKLIPAEHIKFDEKHGKNGRKIELGEGSFGAVFLGTYKALGKMKVAIKRLKGSEHGGLSARDKRDFLKEAQTMYRVRHPDIVSIYGAVCDTETHLYCLVMEYMELGSLDALLDKIEVPWPVKVRMLLSVARGLTFLNTPQPDRNYPVVHCDIKAKNILVNDMFQAKIADFGEAVLQSITSRSVSSRSQDGGHGTVTHMSPELLDPPDDPPNYDPTQLSDVWSFGITIFEVCAENARGTAERRTPFPKKMRDAQIIKMIGTKMESPFNTEQMKKVEGCDCPLYLVDLMRRCCAVDSSKRPVFREITSELEEMYKTECQPLIHRSLRKLHLNYEQTVLRPGSVVSEDEDMSDESFCIESYLTSGDSFDSNSFDMLDGPASSASSWDKMADKEDMRREMEKMKELFILLEQKLGGHSSDISHLRSHVDDVVGLKQDLEEVRQKTGLVSDESDLAAMRNLEKKLHSVAQTVKTNIAQAKEDIISSQENIVKKEELQLMEVRLSSQISQISRPNSGEEDTAFHNAPIQTSCRLLVEEMVADNLVPYLIQEGVLSLDDSERIDKAVTSRDKNRLLLRMVDGKGERGLQKLTESLDYDHMEHLSSQLKKVL